MTSKDWRGSRVDCDIKELQSEHRPLCHRPALILPRTYLRYTRPTCRPTRFNLPGLRPPERPLID